MSEKLIKQVIFLSKISSTLDGNQMARVEEWLDTDSSMSYQEIARFLAPRLNASERDIYSFLNDRDKKNTDDINKNKPN